MLDHREFLHDPDAILQKLRRRGVETATLERLTALAGERRLAIQKVEALRHELNEASAVVQAKAKSGDKEAIEAGRGRLKSLKTEIKEGEDLQAKVEDSLQTLMLDVPNLPQSSVPDGTDASSNSSAPSSPSCSIWRVSMATQRSFRRSW